MRSSALLLLVAILGAESVKLPSHFQKCDRKQEDFKECVLKAAADGIAQLDKPLKDVNLPSLNPLEILELKIEAGKQAVAVDQNFHNCKLYGLDKLQLGQFEFRFENKELYAEAVIPEIRKLCEYDLNGKVLLLPIVGNGASTIVLKDIKATLHLPYNEVQNKGKTHLKFHSNKFTIDPGLVTYNFENLFNGDKQLGDNINSVLNDNWKEVFDDVKGGYEATLGTVVEDLMNRFFSKVSAEEAFD